MADATGIILGTTTNADVKLKVVWRDTLDMANSRSIFVAELYIKKFRGYESRTFGTAYPKFVFDGQDYPLPELDVTLYDGAGDDGWVCLGAQMKYVPRGLDGRASVHVSVAKRAADFILHTSVQNVYLSETVSLAILNRASTLQYYTPRVVLDGESAIVANVALNVNQTLYHKLKLSLGAYEYVSDAFTAGTQFSYTPPEEWANAITSGAVGNAMLTLYTYSDLACLAQVGVESTSVVLLEVPETVCPSTSAGWANMVIDNQLAQGFGVYIQSKSRLKVNIDASKVQPGGFGAQLTAFEVVLDGKTYRTDYTEYFTHYSITTNVMTTPGEKIAYIYAYDSRGRHTEYEYEFEVLEYSPPFISKAELKRCVSDGTPDDTGSYLSALVTGMYSPLADQNETLLNQLTIKCRWKVQGGTYGAYVTLGNGEQSVLAGALSSDITYVAEVCIKDLLSPEAVAEYIIPTERVAFHIKDGGNALGMGMRTAKNDAVEVNPLWGFFVGGYDIAPLAAKAEKLSAFDDSAGSLRIGDMKIAYGTATVAVKNIPSIGTFTSAAKPFGITFSTPPLVIVSGTANAWHTGVFAYEAVDVGTTSFKVRATNPTNINAVSNLEDAVVGYIAIGK